MIEIRELVIRATVDETNRNNGKGSTKNADSEQSEKKGCCSDKFDMLLQIINDKKER